MSSVVELLARNPFPGLRAFAPDEADLFFGRREQIAELLSRVDANPFVAVAGASGCGKSSLVLAGLLKVLGDRAFAEGMPAWRPAILSPGRQPIAHLAAALVAALGLGRTPEDIGALYGRLHLSAIGLADAVRLAALPKGTGVLVVVDQFEELFRYERMTDSEESAAFVKLLLQAALDPAVPVRVVITLRSEALGYCADFPGLAEAVSRGQMLVPKLTRDQRKEAIVGPVRQRGFEIKPSLVQRILNDVPDDFDDLPVMQHALARTWARWATDCAGARAIEVADYEAIGTSTEALDRHGEEALASLPKALRPVAAAVMRALTERRPDGTEVRRPLPFDELCAVVRHDRAEVAAVVDRLRSPETSFLRPPASEKLDDNPAIDITHESLIRQWSSLRQWVQAEADARAELDLLLGALQRKSAGAGDLWQGRALEAVLEWQRKEAPNPAWVRLCAGEAGAAKWPQALKFIADSEAAARAALRRRRLRRWSGALAGVALLGTLVYAGQSRLAADNQAQQRRAQELANLGWQELRLDPALAAHLAVAALDQNADNPHAEQVLRQAVETLSVAHVQSIFDLGVPIVDARPDRSGRRIAVVGGDQLAIVDSADAREVAPRRTLPWKASNVWLLDEAGLVVMQSATQGVHLQGTDGKMLANWNCEGGKEGDFVYTVQISANGRWLAAGCLSGRLALWDLAEPARAPGPPLVLATGFGGSITALAFSPDGLWLASGDADGHALLWKVSDPGAPWLGSVSTGRIETPVSHAKPIRDLDLWASGADQYLATASDDGTAVVWRIDPEHHRLAKPADAKDRVKWTLRHERPVIRARFDKDGKLMTLADKRLRFWQNEEPVPSRSRHNSWITDAAVSPNGEYGVSASEDGVARVWSNGRDAVATLRGHRDSLTRSRFVTDNRIITTSLDGTLRIWAIAPVQTLQSSPGRWMLSAAPSPDGKELAYCAEGRGAGTGSSCGLMPLVDGSPSGGPAAAVLPLSSSFNMVTRIFWTPDKSGILSTGTNYDIFGANKPLHWQRDQGVIVEDEGKFLPYAYSLRRAEGLFIDDQGEIQVRPQAPGAAPQVLRVPRPAYVQTAALSDDGRWIAIGDDKNVLLLDRSAPQAAPRVLPGHQGTVMALDFSADSRLLASAGADRTARVWPLGGPVSPVEMAGGHTGSIYTVAFNHRGDQIVTGSADGTLRAWSVRDGRELVALEWHADAVNDVHFHPSQPTLFSASDDGTVKRGVCWTCEMDLAQLREAIAKNGLAQLTAGDKDYIERARNGGAQARR